MRDNIGYLQLVMLAGSVWAPQGYNRPLDVRRSSASLLRKFCNISMDDMLTKRGGNQGGPDCCWIRVARDLPRKVTLCLETVLVVASLQGSSKNQRARIRDAAQEFEHFDAPRFVWGSGLLRGRNPPTPNEKIVQKEG